MAEQKSLVSRSPQSQLPRVRTYHTREPSRFVHALSARPLKVQGGRESGAYADGMESVFFIFDVCCTPTLSCRGINTYAKHVCWRRRDRGRRRRRPAMIHKTTFILSYFCVTKSTKSHIRERSSLLYISSRVHELVARSSAWQVCAANGGAKVGSFMLSTTSYYHACEHITRKSRADSCTHCLHARYKCKAGVGLVPALTGWRAYFFILAVDGTWTLSCRGRRRRRPERNIKILFF